MINTSGGRGWQTKRQLPCSTATGWFSHRLNTHLVYYFNCKHMSMLITLSINFNLFLWFLLNIIFKYLQIRQSSLDYHALHCNKYIWIRNINHKILRTMFYLYTYIIRKQSYCHNDVLFWLTTTNRL